MPHYLDLSDHPQRIFEMLERDDPHPFERWAAKVEYHLGHSLDGDQKADGYSLDHAYDWFRAGVTVKEAVRRIERARTACAISLCGRKR